MNSKSKSLGSKPTWPLRVGEGDIDDWQTCLTGHGSLRGCWRVASEFSGFLSRGEGESERGGDAGEREGEERGREGETR